MTPGLVGLVRDGVLLALLTAAPFLIGALVAGIVTGLIGAATQLDDPSIALVPRVVAVGLALVLFAPSIGHQLEAFANRIWPMIAAAGTQT